MSTHGDLFNSFYGTRQNNFVNLLSIKIFQCFFLYCTGEKGGGIILTTPIKSVEMDTVSFEHCNALYGGAFYINEINETNIKNCGIFTCFSNSNSAFYSHISAELDISYSSIVDCSSQMKGNDNYFSIITDNNSTNFSSFNNNNITRNKYHNGVSISINYQIINCLFVNQTSLNNYNDFNLYSDTIMNNTFIITDSINIYYINLIMENCTLSLLNSISAGNKLKLQAINCFISFSQSFKNYELINFVNSTEIDPINSTFNIDYNKFKFNPTFHEIKGKQESKINEPDDVAVRVIDSYFTGLKTVLNGGAILLTRKYLLFELEYSSFESCSANYGGALYIGPIQSLNMSSFCGFNCLASVCSFAYLSQYNQTDQKIIQRNVVLSKCPGNSYDCSSSIRYSFYVPVEFHDMNFTNSYDILGFSSFYLGTASFSFTTFDNNSVNLIIFSSFNPFIINTMYVPTDFFNISIDHSVFTNNNCSYLLYCYHFKLSNSIFNKNKCNIYETIEEPQIIDCITDNESILHPELYTITLTMPTYKSINCMIYVEPPKNKKSFYIMVSLISISAVAILIAIIVFIYSRRVKKYADIEHEKRELTRSILNDFG